MISRSLVWIVLTASMVMAGGQAPVTTSQPPAASAGKEYRINPNELLEISVFELPDQNQTARVSPTGTISLKVGSIIKAAGLTPEELQAAIEAELKKNYIKNPRVQVFIREYLATPPVFVTLTGAVRSPGVVQLKDQHFLMDVLSSGGGPSDNAGATIQVMRRRPDATVETTSISIDDLYQNGKTELNIEIHANDTVNVTEAGFIYVYGEVAKPGEFLLRHGSPVSVLEAIARGGGATRLAKKKECQIIRVHADGSKEIIPFNLQRLTEAKDTDFALKVNDIVFIPASKTKGGLTRVLDSVIPVAVNRAVYLP